MPYGKSPPFGHLTVSTSYLCCLINLWTKDCKMNNDRLQAISDIWFLLLFGLPLTFEQAKVRTHAVQQAHIFSVVRSKLIQCTQFIYELWIGCVLRLFINFEHFSFEFWFLFLWLCCCSVAVNILELNKLWILIG